MPPRHLRSVTARGATLHLRLQTIFDGYVLAFRRHPSCVGVLARFTPLSTRNLRLLFRLGEVRPLLSLLWSARAVNLHVPPTHRGSCPCHSVRRLPFIVLDERIEVIAGGTLVIAFSGREDCSLRARRHTSALRCAPVNSIALNPRIPFRAGQCVGYGECVKATSPPLTRGRYAGEDQRHCHTLPKQVRPARLPFVGIAPLRRLFLHSKPSNADTTPCAP